MKLAKSAGAPAKAMATGQMGMGVALDDTHVFATCRFGSAVASAAKSGGSTATLASMGGSHVFGGLAVDGANVCWGSQGTAEILFKADKSKGGASALYSQQGSNVSAVALSGTDVYFAPYDADHPHASKLMRIAKSGGSAVTLASCASPVNGISVVAGEVFYSCGGDVLRMKEPGGSPSVLASGLGTITSLAADATHVFVASYVTLMNAKISRFAR